MFLHQIYVKRVVFWNDLWKQFDSKTASYTTSNSRYISLPEYRILEIIILKFRRKYVHEILAWLYSQNNLKVLGIEDQSPP